MENFEFSSFLTFLWILGKVTVARWLRDCCKDIAMLLRDCCNIVARLLQDCCNVVARLLQGCCKTVARDFFGFLPDVMNILDQCHSLQNVKTPKGHGKTQNSHGHSHSHGHGHNHGHGHGHGQRMFVLATSVKHSFIILFVRYGVVE